MHAFRCPDCGETRWSLFQATRATAPECPICATEMVAERRRPAAAAVSHALTAERRDLTAQPPRA